MPTAWGSLPALLPRTRGRACTSTANIIMSLPTMSFSAFSLPPRAMPCQKRTHHLPCPSQFSHPPAGRYPERPRSGRDDLDYLLSVSCFDGRPILLVRPMGTERLAECRHHGRRLAADALPGLAAGLLSCQHFFRQGGRGRCRCVTEPVSRSA